MVMRPDDAAGLAKGVREIFVEAENILLQKIAGQLAKGLDDPAWAEQKLLNIRALLIEVDKVIADLAAGVPGAVARALQFAYQRGIAAASAEAAAAGLGAAAFTEVQPTGAVAALVTATVASQPEQMFQIRRAVVDIYQQVITQTTAQVNAGVLTRREASKAALVKLAGQGVTTFVDTAGRRWDMGSYNEMAVRTSAMNSMLQGTTDRLGELGLDLVIVSDAPEECKLCRPFEGKVLSMSGRRDGDRLKDGVRVSDSLAGAKSAGLFHPNCRHSFSMYLPGITKRQPPVADPAGDALRQQQRAFERRVRELKRADALAFEFGGPEAAAARAKLRAKQAEFKDWREANGRKDLAYRTSLTSR